LTSRYPLVGIGSLVNLDSVRKAWFTNGVETYRLPNTGNTDLPSGEFARYS
jgi:hypothetical protein